MKQFEQLSRHEIENVQGGFVLGVVFLFGVYQLAKGIDETRGG